MTFTVQITAPKEPLCATWALKHILSEDSIHFSRCLQTKAGYWLKETNAIPYYTLLCGLFTKPSLATRRHLTTVLLIIPLIYAGISHPVAFFQYGYKIIQRIIRRCHNSADKTFHYNGRNTSLLWDLSKSNREVYQQNVGLNQVQNSQMKVTIKLIPLYQEKFNISFLCDILHTTIIPPFLISTLQIHLVTKCQMRTPYVINYL